MTSEGNLLTEIKLAGGIIHNSNKGRKIQELISNAHTDTKSTKEKKCKS